MARLSLSTLLNYIESLFVDSSFKSIVYIDDIPENVNNMFASLPALGFSLSSIETTITGGNGINLNPSIVFVVADKSNKKSFEANVDSLALCEELLGILGSQKKINIDSANVRFVGYNEGMIYYTVEINTKLGGYYG